MNAQHSVFGEFFVIFSFAPDNDAVTQDVVSAEHLRDDFSIEGKRDTHLDRIAFEMLGNASLDPESSRALMADTADSYWSTQVR